MWSLKKIFCLKEREEGQLLVKEQETQSVRLCVPCRRGTLIVDHIDGIWGFVRVFHYDVIVSGRYDSHVR